MLKSLVLVEIKIRWKYDNIIWENILTDLEIQNAFDELLKDQTVIFAVLKKLNIRYDHPLYDDLISEAYFLYLKAYPTNNGEGRQRFSYFYTKIYWGLLDLLKREYKISEKNIFDSTECLDDQIFEKDLEFLFEEKELLNQIKMICTDKEWIFIQKILNGIPMAEIARQLGISRQTLYRYRRKLQTKLTRFFK